MARTIEMRNSVPVTTQRAIILGEFNGYITAPKEMAMVKQAEPARNTIDMGQSIRAHFCKVVLPGCGSILGNRRI